MTCEIGSTPAPNVHSTQKTQPPKGQALLQSIKIGSPMQLVAAETIGPIPESNEENSYISVASDYFTWWVGAYAIPNQEATTAAKKLTDEFQFFSVSLPLSSFTQTKDASLSKRLAEVCHLLQINKTHTTLYRPPPIQQSGRTTQPHSVVELSTAGEEKILSGKNISDLSV